MKAWLLDRIVIKNIYEDKSRLALVAFLAWQTFMAAFLKQEIEYLYPQKTRENNICLLASKCFLVGLVKCIY